MSGFYNSLAKGKVTELKVVIPPRMSGFYNSSHSAAFSAIVVIPPRMSGFYNVICVPL